MSQIGKPNSLSYLYLMRHPSQQYFYHSDHLGSSSFISEASGEACQFLAYLPFGEQWVDQHDSYDTPYKFSGKELDAETGYNYFGARYYDSGLSVWLSVDPMAKKYPFSSNYAYVDNSPVTHIDIKGMFKVDILFKKHNKVYNYLKNQISKDALRDNTKSIIMKHSTFNEASLKTELADNSGAHLESRMPGMGAFGEYTKTSTSSFGEGYINLNPVLVQEANNILTNPNSALIEKQGALLAIYNTVLHETIHHGRDKNGQPDNETLEDGTSHPDYGNSFELELWGENLGEISSTMPGNTPEERSAKAKTYISECTEYVKKVQGTEKENLLPKIDD